VSVILMPGEEGYGTPFCHQNTPSVNRLFKICYKLINFIFYNTFYTLTIFPMYGAVFSIYGVCMVLTAKENY
jgi:hypothetical protein